VTDCESSSLNRHQTDDPDRVRAKQVRSRKAEALRECDAVLRRLPRPGEPYILQLQGAQKPN